MSSINPFFTFNYSQPEGYRFSHDSVFLARRVFELVGADVTADWRILDLCAGCGIVGMDFLFHLRAAGRPLPMTCDFLEVQEVYAEHFLENARQFPELNLNFLNGNYAEFGGEAGYDLILCNPPFFQTGEGKLSPNEFKNRCRFFIDSDFPALVLSIGKNLAPRGRAYMVIRELGERVSELLGPRFQVRKLDEIRGNLFLEISRQL